MNYIELLFHISIIAKPNESLGNDIDPAPDVL